MQGLVAFSGYVLVSILLWGLPVLGHLSTTYVGIGGADAKLYAWSLLWWPHALGHGANPFISHAVWAPGGINMAWVTGLPGPSLLTAPITLSLGPIVSSNILNLLAPPLAAWGAYLVCRRVTRAFLPSLAGGYLFGFSTYEVAQMHGHLNLVLIFPVPLCVYLVLRRLDGSMARTAFVLLLTAALVGQFSISTELFFTMTLFGGVALVGAFLFGPAEMRGRLLAAAGPIALAYVLAGVVLSPYLYYALKAAPFGPLRDVEHASVDLLSFVLPRSGTLIGGEALQHVTRSFTLNLVEDGAYLSLPLLLVLGHFALTRRDRRSWLLLGLVAFLAIASLGPVLHVRGHETVWLPWRLPASLPLIQDALPERFTLYVWLVVGIVVAMWLADAFRRSWVRWGVVGLGALMILPNVASPPYHPTVRVPAFFADGTYRQYLTPGETILPIPFAHGEGMLWQTETDLYFRQAGAYVGPVPPQYESDRIVRYLLKGYPALIDPPLLALWIKTHDVGAIVVDDSRASRWAELLSTLGQKPLEVGGVTLYRLEGTPGHPVEPLPSVFTGDLRPGGTLGSFVLPRLGGAGTVTYRRFSRKPLLIGFFASWCPDCAGELRSLERAHRLLGARVGFLGVAQSDEPKKAITLLRKAGVTFPSAADALGKLFSGFAGTTMPLTAFIGPGGRVVAVRGGPLSPKAIATLVRRYFG